MNIDEMLAGRELDALIAERIMGWRQRYIQDIYGQWVPMFNEPEYLNPPSKWAEEAEKVPCYSTNIAATWEVIEKLGIANDSFCLEFGMGQWVCYFGDYYSVAGDAPLAICRAALKAVGYGGD